jgi:hypothetical protein
MNYPLGYDVILEIPKSSGLSTIQPNQLEKSCCLALQKEDRNRIEANFSF